MPAKKKATRLNGDGNGNGGAHSNGAHAPSRGRPPRPAVSPTTAIAIAKRERVAEIAKATDDELLALGLDGLAKKARELRELEKDQSPRDQLDTLELEARVIQLHEELRQRQPGAARAAYFSSKNLKNLALMVGGAASPESAHEFLTLLAHLEVPGPGLVDHAIRDATLEREARDGALHARAQMLSRLFAQSASFARLASMGSVRPRDVDSRWWREHSRLVEKTWTQIYAPTTAGNRHAFLLSLDRLSKRYTGDELQAAAGSLTSQKEEKFLRLLIAWCDTKPGAKRAGSKRQGKWHEVADYLNASAGDHAPRVSAHQLEQAWKKKGK